MNREAASGLTPQEIASRGIAPIKAEFLRPAEARVYVDALISAGAHVESAKAKSKKQRRREVREQKASAALVCNNFLKGTCRFGAQCKVNHDIEAFLKQKAQDLPGSCPFSSTEECPYGIGCRWASTHTSLEPAVQEFAHLIRACAFKPAPLGPLDGLDCSSQRQDTASDLPQSDAGKQPSPAHFPGGTSEPALQPEQPSGPAALQIHVALPVAEQILTPMNKYSKDLQDLQTRLWKRRYDFTLSDGILEALGVKNSRSENDTERRAVCVVSQDPLPHHVDAKMDPTESADPAGRESGSTSAVSSAEPSVQAPVAARVCEDAPKSPICESNLYIEVPLRPEEKRAVDFRDKLYLAPLTTLGNLPFRRVCRGLGADVTCGEMAMATNLLQGQASEWALLRRHPCEKLFGVQVCGGYGDCLTHCAQLLEENVGVDFVDLNLGCPIDLVVGKGAGSALLLKPKRMEDIVRGMSGVLSCPVTLKMRKGYHDGEDVVRSFLPSVAGWGASAVTIHGRSRAQRYSRLADWDYIEACAADAPQLQMIGNGDIFSYMDWERHMQGSGLATCMVGRAALIKPWLFTEIKERRHWDISATERLDMLKEFCSFGLEHWGSDTRGVETTRRFLLEWLSFLYRYVPVSLLDIVPQHVQWRVPPFVGRSDLETLLSSDNAGDWVKISSMLLGPAPEGFVFTPKHKSHAYVVDGSGELENG